MPQRIKAIVRYDGTDFAGWQVQPDEKTVQGKLEAALSRIAGHGISVQGAGRTDSGVHALGQVFHFDWDGPKTPRELRRSISQMLSPAIRVDSMEVAAPDFHARYDAMSKRYTYVLCTDSEPDPFSVRYAWRLQESVDTERVAALAQQLAGTHDFAGYASAGSEVKTTVRTLHSIRVRRGPIIGAPDTDSHWRIELHGDGFLYKMVRNIVGALIDVARDRQPENHIAGLLDVEGPYPGPTAPARGLFLMQVNYAEQAQQCQQ